MNCAKKGNRIERELDKKLKSYGFVTHRAIRSMFNANDIWGCFDIMAKHPKILDKTHYFQVSTQWKSGLARIEIESFLRGMYDNVYMVRRKPRSDFEFKKLTDDGWIKIEFNELL